MQNQILNEEQKKILNSKDIINLVISGPGTGKTFLIINKYKKLLSEIRDPKKILVLSFTKNSVKNIKDNLFKLFEYKGSNIKIKTLHSQFLEMLNSLEKYKNYEINEDISEEIIKEIFKKRDWEKFFWKKEDCINFLKQLKLITSINNRKLTEKDIYKEYYSKKNTNIDPAEFEEAIKSLNIKSVEEAIEEYNKNLKEKLVWDYTDLTTHIFNELSNNEEFRKNWKDRYDAILIDEFQDLDILKIKIIKMIYQPKRTHILFVGDPNQCIYEFRGVAINIVDVIKKLFAIKTTHFLSINYRNPAKIITASNRIISLNTDCQEHLIKLKTNKTEEGEEEIEYISSTTYENEHKKIAIKIQKLIYIKNEDPENIAILYRKGSNSKRIDNLKKTLSEYGIPFITNIGEEVENENYTRYKKEMEKYICLTTIHKSKSKEWKYVFLISMDEGEFPCIQAINSGNINEERRLAYVAFTRAKKRLFLSSGSENASRFLKELRLA